MERSRVFQAAEDFLAVPMVEGQAAAGRGKDIQEGIKGWVLVRRSKYFCMSSQYVVGDSDFR